MDIWAEVGGEEHIASMMATIHRVVEDQEDAATLSLVNNIEEQGVLEDLLEQSKPKKQEGCEALHYLLITPFRYPPLQYGSRFGSNFEPSLLYGSLNISTALAETAYYRFVYLSGMKEAYAKPILMTYSSYTASIRTDRSVFLDKKPFNSFEEIMTSPDNYSDTQKLGDSMRHASVEAFQYISARDPEQGKNIALFTPKTFQSKKPIHIERWICNITHEEIGFVSNDKQRRLRFDKRLFLVDGKIPAPSC